ncbi:MAG: flagellar basal body rod protein FlgB [Campylobacterota bacterium]|nr:flagellar basal body rod protein FlgB [Campylobacterota bacterium]
MIQINRAHAVADAALDYRAMRQDLIAGNIANVDTPFYRPRDVDFKSTLIQKHNELYKKDTDQLEMAHTNSAHLTAQSSQDPRQATLFFRDGHSARNDGNSVDLDVETSELSKNAMMFTGLISARKKSAAIFRAVLDASAKTQ